MKRLSAGILFLPFFVSSFSQVPDSLKYQLLTPRDFHTRYLNDTSVMLIDVRETAEIKKKIKGAVIIPSKGNLDFATDTIDRKKSLYIYCASGIRSRRVAIVFYEKGFRKLYSLEGGIAAWQEEGFPVVKKRNREK